MSLTALTSQVHYLPADDALDRPALGYVRGDRFALQVDAGTSHRHAALLTQALPAGWRQPDYTVLTHWHWDHSFGLHAAPGRTIAGHLTQEKLAMMAAWTWTDEAMQQRLATGADLEMCDHYIRQEYPDRRQIQVALADIVFTGQLCLDLGGVHAVMRELTAPHTEDTVIIHIPEEGVIFLGDADLADYNHGNVYERAKVRGLLAALTALDFHTCVIGHGGPQTKEELLTSLQQIERASSVRIEVIPADKKRFLELLLLGDEQEEMIDRYLERGELFALYDDGLKGVAVMTQAEPGICELKNIAVVPAFQGQGYGRQLVEHLCRRYRTSCHTMLVGTGDSAGILHFYDRCGFTVSHRLPGFFTTHYDHPLYEEGKQLVDMIYLRRDLTAAVEQA